MNEIYLPPTKAQGKYNGQALRAFYNAIPNKSIQDDMLRHVGLDEIDPGKWYDLHLARTIYYGVEQLFGPATVRLVGKNIIENAVFPAEIDSPLSALKSIETAYRLNVTGTDLGDVSVKELDSGRVSLTFSTPFPCLFEKGIMIGCATKFGAHLRIEHDEQKCRSQGHDYCEFLVKILA